ncbi:DUF2971 domain-containing protein [Sneathiella chungangensis]|uniref:DUF2971 domain-containing protein n=1 Tax=Sneathiella chungangensis TaxID=1418234 RepID=A0A845M8I4_9PROT|nr:DUF2971 domain-containing protein [Sneathiella chungangensis]MZR20765.1 DUF2971 domain-containing protein [Sneathiella chungangensis]
MNADEKLHVIPEHWKNGRLHFFKYVSAKTAKIILENRTLRWTTPINLNDPFDLQFGLKVKVDFFKLKKICREKLWEIYKQDKTENSINMIGGMVKTIKSIPIDLNKEEFIEIIDAGIETAYNTIYERLPEFNAGLIEGLSNSKILCMTIKPNNKLMWAHYADNHRGVVLRFRSVPAFDSAYGSAMPMNYVDEIPELMDLDYMADFVCGFRTFDHDERMKIMDKVVYTKSSEWRYEDEWRMHAGSGRSHSASFEDIPFSKNELDGIVFGLKISDRDRAEIESLSKNYPNIQLMSAKRSDGEFNIIVENY